MDNSDDWVSAKETLAILTANGESPAVVQDMIASYLRNGDLRAQAKYIWESSAKSPSRAWKECPPEPNGGDVPRLHWRSEKSPIEDRARWRMVANRLLMTKRLKPLKRVMMRGVKFSRADLAKLQPDHFLEGRRKGSRGPTPDIAKRNGGWLALFELALVKDLNRQDIESQDEFVAMLYDEVQKPGGCKLGKNKVAEICRLAYPRLPEKRRERETL